MDWPSYALIVAGAGAERGARSVERPQFDDGMVAQRRRWTRALKRIEVRFILVDADKSRFEEWAASSHAWFDWRDETRARVLGGQGGIEYRERAVAGVLTWDGRCELEVIA